jgi:CheY-like chemotaxis protein
MMQRVIAKLDGDIRNEMHSLMAMLELIAEGPLTDAQYEHLRTCKSSADRLLRSVETVCQFVCPDTSEPELSEIDLHEFITSMAGVMQQLAQPKGLSLTAEIRPGTPARVTGDCHRLEDILVRLIDNSIRSADHGSIQLIVTKGEDDSDRSRIDFIVCDEGRWTSEDLIAHALDSTTPDLEYHGLGLAIVQQLVRGMGGGISIDRQDGEGSRVTVSLPFKALDGSAGPALSGAKDIENPSWEPVRPLNILVAEDSDQSYYVIESYLEGQGCQLSRALDGASAVEQFKTGRYDLVLMDIHMPVMNGYAATRAIRDWETTDGRARVPIVVLSSDSPATQRENGAKAGCSGYITKPASKAAVLASLRRFAGTGTQD